jgi:uncharacterized membrane protein YoaT (DUF817 family)
VKSTPAHALGAYLQPLRALIKNVLAPLPEGVREFIVFGLKMAWACLFGAIFLILMIATFLWWPKDAPLYRYDFLLLMAVIIQILMLLFRLESFDEFKVIMVYHIIGTVMEIFKTSVGSWVYPEPAIFKIYNVPLFTGFMYATIGSYIARSIRVFDMRFSHYPKAYLTYLLGLCIYVNFFSHHYIYDIRNLIFIAMGGLFFKTWIHFRVDTKIYKMPFLLAGALTAFFVWVAENIGTFTRTWVYTDQVQAWRIVSLHKMGAWALLLLVSFVIVTLIVKIKDINAPKTLH